MIVRRFIRRKIRSVKNTVRHKRVGELNEPQDATNAIQSHRAGTLANGTHPGTLSSLLSEIDLEKKKFRTEFRKQNRRPITGTRRGPRDFGRISYRFLAGRFRFSSG